MKYSLIIAVMLFSISLSAQTKSASSKSKTTVQNKKQKNTNTSAGSASKNQPDVSNSEVAIRDRIAQRLRDSASAANNKNSTQTNAGIPVSAQGQGAVSNAQSKINYPATNNNVKNSGNTVNNNPNNTNNNQNTNGTNAQGQRINNIQQNNNGAAINTNNTANNMGTNYNNSNDINQSAAGTVISNSAVANKPISNEQSQYTTTDLNRAQLNNINQNQNASAAQNPASAVASQNNIVGENQWGQNQVGENQWTPPPAIITSGFTRDYPTIRGAVWSRDNNNNFVARYKTGDLWTSSMYNANGLQMETRIELLSTNFPAPINTFKAKQNADVQINRIAKVVRPNKPDVYEVQLSTGRVTYINADGIEVPF